MSFSPNSQGFSTHAETGGEERKFSYGQSDSDEYRHQNFITQPTSYLDEGQASKIENQFDFAEMLGREVETSFMEIQQRLLNKVYKLYRPQQEYGLRKKDRIGMLDTEVYGLEHISKHMALIRGDRSLFTYPESRKLNVMLMGNHSVGKSSYINWYLGEKLLKEGVAMETQGVHIVTSGAKYTYLKGNATLKAFPFLGRLIDERTRQSKVPGLIESLTTTISPSKNRYFGSVNFIDTPGITDGALRYPFDMEDALVWLAENAADLVLVFFDPIGQTLCKKTMSIVQKIDQICPNKLHFFLSKADTITNQGDRYKVLAQISQGLASTLQAKHAMQIPLIYIPKTQPKHEMLRKSKTLYERLPDMGGRVPNKIEETAITIYEQAATKAERVLHKLKKDISTLDQAVERQV